MSWLKSRLSRWADRAAADRIQELEHELETAKAELRVAGRENELLGNMIEKQIARQKLEREADNHARALASAAVRAAESDS